MPWVQLLPDVRLFVAAEQYEAAVALTLQVPVVSQEQPSFTPLAAAWHQVAF